MEVKPGYKQTEVGVIPQDWQVAPLSELITEFRGGAPLKPSDFTRSGIKVLPKGAVGRTGWLHIDEDDVQFCSPSYAASHSGNQVNETCTIVVLRDLVPSGPSIGLIVQIKEPATFVLAQGVYGFKTNQRALPGYLVQLSNTRWYRKLMNSIMVGSTQVHITNTAYKLAKVPLPPPSEQRAIAAALSDVDALLRTQDRLIAKKRDLKQAAMQQLLTGQIRLPGFHGEWEVKPLGQIASRGRTPHKNASGMAVKSSYKRTEVGVIPEDWRVVALENVCNFENGDRSSNYPSPRSFVESGIPFINAGHVADGKIVLRRWTT